MPLKIIIHVDTETGEVEHFPWTEKEKPPPLVRKKKPEPDKGPGHDEKKDKPS